MTGIRKARRHHANNTSRAQYVARRWPLISGLGALALTVSLGYLVMLRGAAQTAGGTSLALDRAWIAGMAWIDPFRGPILDPPALVLNYLGSG